MFDKDIAPFQQKYIHLVEDIHNVYGTAKEVGLWTALHNIALHHIACGTRFKVASGGRVSC